METGWSSMKCRGGVIGQLRLKRDPKPLKGSTRTLRGGAGGGRSHASHLSIDIHLSRAEQQADHLQVPNFGCMVEAGGAILLLRETWGDEFSCRHLEPGPGPWALLPSRHTLL